jgi:SAM-dependent methyltransferase
MDLKEEDILGDAIGSHWYYKSKAAALLRYIQPANHRCILDVGAGSGFFTKYLLRHTPASHGLCVDVNYSDERDDETIGKLIRFRKSCEQTDADLVLFMDVLEHVDDDVGLLTEYVRKVPSGAQFLITAPAFQFLWSGHDDFLEHRRRYTRNGLGRVVEKAGLEALAVSYYFGLVFPIAAALRIGGKLTRRQEAEPRSDLKRHHPLTNAVLTALCGAELPFVRLNRLAGLSVFCLAQKP